MAAGGNRRNLKPRAAYPAPLPFILSLEVMSMSQDNRKDEPTVAPGMNMQDQIEEKATAEEVERGDSTSVTRLYLDRTPED